MSEPDLDDFYADLENVNNDTTTTTNTTTTNNIDNNNNADNKLKRKLDDIDSSNNYNNNNSPTKKINTASSTTKTTNTTTTTTTNANKSLIPPSLMKKKQVKPAAAASSSSTIVKSSKAVTYSAPTTTTSSSSTSPTISVVATDLLYRQPQQQRSSNYLNIAALRPQVTMEEPKKPTTITMEAAGETWVDPTLSEWDENDFRIFVGDLGNDVTDDMLRQAFIKYPTFLKAKVIRDSKSGKTKGFGFVSFSGSTDFMNAMRDMNGKYVGNRPIKLRKSKWKERLAGK